MRHPRPAPSPRRAARRVVGALLLVLACVPDLPAQVAAPERTPRSLVLFIADGCGPTSLTLARQASGPLALDALLVGSVATRSASSHITDSAASGTALATGVATDNKVIGLDPAGGRLVSLLEKAKAAGMRVGVVTTTSVTHATPASFTAHVPSRYDEPDIAVQQVVADVDVLLGGGARFFVPASEAEPHGRTDGRDLLAEARDAGRLVVTTAAELDALDGGDPETPVLGVFASEHLAYVLDARPAAQPSLLRLATFAVERLSAGGAPFVLVVEGGRIDHAAHDNDVAAHLAEILDFDATVSAFVDDNPDDRLVVSVSDHETGGLSLGRNRGLLGAQDWDPSVLTLQTASLEGMLERAKDGEDVAAVFLETCGLADLSDAELSAVGDAKAWVPGLRLESTEDVAKNGLSRALMAPLASRAGVAWSTWWHTAVDVPLFATGPGSARFAGHHTHPRLGRLLQEVLGLAGE